MAKTNFAQALDEVLKHEGGYVDHPKDPGGATNLGVTIGTLSGWLGRKATKAEVKALTKAEVAPIYRKNYWDAVRGDDLPAGVDFAVFDFAVNSGPDRAARMLQKIVGVAVDGIIGPQTLAAIERIGATAIIGDLCSQRLAFLQGLKTWPTFGKGWSRRVSEVRAKALAMAATSAQSPPRESAPQVSTAPPEPVPKSGVAGFVILGAVILGVAAFFIARATGGIQ